MDRDEFFAELDQLTPAEIQERLSSWDVEQLVLAQEYLAHKEREQTRAALAAQAETSTTKNDTARLSVEVARRAHTTAMMALIFSVGGMLTAIAAAVLAFLALRGATISW
jgi:hypothetical protein